MTTDLSATLVNVKGCQIATLVYESKDSDIPQKAGFGTVTKLVETQMQVGYDYEKAVNRRLKAAGKPANFSAKNLPWGSWLVANKVITHKGKNYARLYEFANAPIKVTYFCDGVPATAKETADIIAYKASKAKGSNTQAAAGLSEDEQVKPKCVEFGNIVWLKVAGETYLRDFESRQQIAV